MDIGSIIKDQYKVIEHIGRGGMADVWSARDMRLRRLVAIKTIAKGLSADVDPVALFEKEAQTIAAMEHPHILPIYDFGEFEGNLYIVMRFITNGSLEHRLRGGPMEVQDVLKMGDAIARALDYAHDNNIIHLDLKPPNILLGTQQTPYLADFGLATVLDVEGRARNPGSGTLLYMAPEQIVAEVIDRRADIYSFTIMLYHMLTSRLPFDGTAPLALMQLQTGRSMPDITKFVPALPESVNDILRYGTAQNPQDRPATLSELMEEFRNLIAPSSTLEFSASAFGLDELDGITLNMRTQQFVNEGAQELLEAVDVYSRARQQWAGGQGRFTLGMSPFLLISGYYQDAARYDLTIDESGYQMLLRGALEYDTDIDYWWGKLNDENRREVCLHALRSLSAATRIRALNRLEGLRDDPVNPVIPRLIGQALEIERSDDVKLTALRVLRHRARALPRRVKVKTTETSIVQQSMTRLGVQLITTADWPDGVYAPELDTLIAKMALDTESPDVAEYAARTIGHIRSLESIQYIATAQLEGRRGALQALAFIRDEAPALPPIVSRQGRLYAWITNTAHRLTERPLEAILRFVLVLLGGWIGMGELVYSTFRSQGLFTPQRWSNTIAIGLIFGLFLAITVFVADEFSRRLERFWQGWLRLLLFGALGYLMGTITWGAYTWMFMQYTPQWDMMRLAGGGMALGIVLAALLQLRGLPAIAFTTVISFLPLLALHRNYYEWRYFTVTGVFPLGLLWGGLIGWLWRRRVPEMAYSPRSAARPARTGPRSSVHAVMDIPQWPAWARVLLAGLGGAGFAAAAWFYIGITYQAFPVKASAITWDTVIGMFAVSLLLGLFMSYASKPGPRLAFFTVGVVALLALEVMPGMLFYNTPFQPLNMLGWNPPVFQTVPFSPKPAVAMIYFNAEMDPYRRMILLTVLPTVFVFSLGVYGLLLWRDVWTYVGAPRAAYERSGWLTGVLIYGLVATAAIGILSLFSLHVSIPWGLMWSAWGFFTWLCLVATWRWARWGAVGLVVASVLLIFGGVAADVFESQLAQQAGQVPLLEKTLAITLHPGAQATLLDVIATAPLLWLIGGLGLVLAVRSAQQRKLWGYVASTGLVLLLGTAFVISRMPAPAEGAAASAVTLSIQVEFLWGLWGVALLAALAGALYRQLWSAIALIGLIMGWFLVVLFGGVGGSYTVLAATHAVLVLYALRPDWAKMEPNRFHWPWQGATATHGTLRLAAVPLSAVAVQPPSEAEQAAGPTILRERPATPETEAAPDFATQFAGAPMDLQTSLMPNDPSLLRTEVIVDEEAASTPNLKTDVLNTMIRPSETPDLSTSVEGLTPEIKKPGEFPRLRLGQTGPLGDSSKPPSVPRIRLDTGALDRSRMAETMPPVAPPSAEPKQSPEQPTVEAFDLHNAHTEAVPHDLKPTQDTFSGDAPPTVETFDLHNAHTEAVPPELRPQPPAETPPASGSPSALPRIRLGTGQLKPPAALGESGPTLAPKATPEGETPSESGPTLMPKIKLGDEATPPSGESGPTIVPKLKLGGVSGESGATNIPKLKLGGDSPRPTTDSSSSGGSTVPGVKINMSSFSKPPTPGQTSLPKMKLEGESAPPVPPAPTPPVQKHDDIEDGEFEELPPDKE